MTKSSPPSKSGPRRRWLERTLRAIGLISLGAALFILAEGRIYQFLGRWQLGMVDPAETAADSTRAAGVWLGSRAGELDDPRIALAVDGVVEATGDLPWDAWSRWAADRLPALQRQIERRRSVAARAPDRAPAPGTPVGTISIPELGLDAVILEGVGEQVLRRGVGHFPQTAMPGAGRNFALAGHRDTFFRGLRNVRKGQRVVITTADGREHAYLVESTEVIEPTEVEVIDDVGREVLTLITCYPFNYVGPAPRRFVVRGYPEPLEGAEAGARSPGS